MKELESLIIGPAEYCSTKWENLVKRLFQMESYEVLSSETLFIKLSNNWLLTETLHLKLMKQKEYIKLTDLCPNKISIFNDFGFVAKTGQNKNFQSYNLIQKIRQFHKIK